MSATCIPRLSILRRVNKCRRPIKTEERGKRGGKKNRTRKDHGSDKHGPRIPDGIRENDPAPDRLPQKNHLRSVKMNHQKPNSRKLPMKDGTMGRLLIGRRNRSKTSFEYSVSSNELRMPFEVHPNKFEVRIRRRARNFEFLRISTGRSSNNFELLRMNPALPPD
jgi:hypothetical protein